MRSALDVAERVRGSQRLQRSCPLAAAPARAGGLTAPARGEPHSAAAPPQLRVGVRVKRAARAAQALLQLAGVQAAPGGGEQGLVVDGAKWTAFRDWFAKGLRTLKQVRAPRRQPRRRHGVRAQAGPRWRDAQSRAGMFSGEVLQAWAGLDGGPWASCSARCCGLVRRMKAMPGVAASATVLDALRCRS